MRTGRERRPCVGVAWIVECRLQAFRTRQPHARDFCTLHEMRRGLWQVLIESFVVVHGVLSLLLGILVALVLYVALPSDDWIIRLLVAVIIGIVAIAVIVIVTLLHALARLSRSTGGLPKIRAGRPPFDRTRATLVCVADPSELFNIGIWVAFFRVTEEDVQEPIGVGSVVNVEDDGKIVLEMARVFREHEDFAQRVRNNDAGALKKLRVKPYFSQQMFGSYEERR